MPNKSISADVLTAEHEHRRDRLSTGGHKSGKDISTVEHEHRRDGLSTRG